MRLVHSLGHAENIDSKFSIMTVNHFFTYFFRLLLEVWCDSHENQIRAYSDYAGKIDGFHVYIQKKNLMACCQNDSETVSLQGLGILTPNIVRATLNTPHQLDHSAPIGHESLGIKSD